MGIWARWKAHRKRKQIVRARVWIARTPDYPSYPDGSTELPLLELVTVPCAACGEALLADPEEEHPMHVAGCPIRPWRRGDEPRTWDGSRGHGL